MSTPLMPEQLRLQAGARFEQDFSAIQKATPRRERVRGEAWVTDYSRDSDIGLGKKVVEGGRVDVVLQVASDFTSEMVAALSPGAHGLLFRHYVKGPDDGDFKPTDMTQAEAGERFMELLDRAEVALLQ